MPYALEIRDLHKCFVAGDDTCRIAASVLRGVDLTVRDGECVAIVGPAGAGKSTLLLCAAGLMQFDRGRLRWFGDGARRSAERRVRYYADDPASSCAVRHAASPMLHLLDIADGMPVAGLREWIADRRSRGDALVIATRLERLPRSQGARLLGLRGGALFELEPSWDRVAERAR